MIVIIITSKGPLGNYTTMTGAELFVAGGATDDWYISQGATYGYHFLSLSANLNVLKSDFLSYMPFQNKTSPKITNQYCLNDD